VARIDFDALLGQGSGDLFAHGPRMGFQIITHGLGFADGLFLSHFSISVSGLRLHEQVLPPESTEQSARQSQSPHSMTVVLDMLTKRVGGACLLADCAPRIAESL
jgi:hypothetical protein